MRFPGMRFWITALAVVSSTAVFASERFDPNICKLQNRAMVLCFDLRDDAHPHGGLVINVGAQDNKERTIFLPFPTLSFSPDASILASWGRYDHFTIVTFMQANAGMHDIGFEPLFGANADQLDESMTSESLLFLRRGLERRFVYRHVIPSSAANFPIETQHLDDSINAIAVVRPEKAVGLELANGKTETPEPLPESRSTRFYEVTTNGKPSIVELRYELPPTDKETIILTYSSKVAGALAGPFIAILFFKLKENIRPRTRRAILWGLGLLQFSLMALFAYTAWTTRGETAGVAVGDWSIVILTAVVSALPLWLQREPPSLALTVKP